MLTSSDLKRMLVPTLDIDLMWHTHQLWNYGYFKDCLESPCHTGLIMMILSMKINWTMVMNTPVNVSQVIQTGIFSLLLSFLYYASICHHQQILILMKSGSKQMRLEEKTIVKNPLFSKEEGFSHISTHNSIKLPTSQAQMKRRKSITASSLEKIRTIPIIITFLILPCLLYYLAFQ